MRVLRASSRDSVGRGWGEAAAAIIAVTSVLGWRWTWDVGLVPELAILLFSADETTGFAEEAHGGLGDWGNGRTLLGNDALDASDLREQEWTELALAVERVDEEGGIEDVLGELLPDGHALPEVERGLGLGNGEAGAGVGVLPAQGVAKGVREIVSNGNDGILAIPFLETRQKTGEAGGVVGVGDDFSCGLDGDGGRELVEKSRDLGSGLSNFLDVDTVQHVDVSNDKFENGGSFDFCLGRGGGGDCLVAGSGLFSMGSYGDVVRLQRLFEKGGLCVSVTCAPLCCRLPFYRFVLVDECLEIHGCLELEFILLRFVKLKSGNDAELVVGLRGSQTILNSQFEHLARRNVP
jgi:hypothetical protein